MEHRASPQGAQQDALVKISTLLMLSHAESCVLTARLKHLLHGGRRSRHPFGWNKRFSSKNYGRFQEAVSSVSEVESLVRFRPGPDLELCCCSTCRQMEEGQR